jgi:hypothetical protein
MREYNKRTRQLCLFFLIKFFIMVLIRRVSSGWSEGLIISVQLIMINSLSGLLKKTVGTMNRLFSRLLYRLSIKSSVSRIVGILGVPGNCLVIVLSGLPE